MMEVNVYKIKGIVKVAIIYGDDSLSLFSMGETTLNVINSINNRKITKSLTLKDLVSYIKSPDLVHKDTVELARSFGKGSLQYETIKKTKVPCVVLNFLHSKGYVKGSTVIKPTGYLYIDVDSNLSVDLSNKHIAAYWKSLSGTGYSIVVAVNGLTKHNLKRSTIEVAELLDIPLDMAAISVDRLTCISYDPEAYYNPNAVIYHLLADDKELRHSVSTDNSLSMGLRTDGAKIHIRTNNLNDIIDNIDFKGQVIYDLGEGGVPYADIRYSIYGVQEGKRNSVMFATVCQLRALNIWCCKGRMLNYVKGLNRKAFRPCLSTSEVEQIVNNVYSLKKITLNLNAKRRFIYNTDYDLTPKNKRSLTAKKISESIKNKNDNLLNEIIENWDFGGLGKISRYKISKVSNLSIKTVERRYSSIKEKIKQKNLDYKNNK